MSKNIFFAPTGFDLISDYQTRKIHQATLKTLKNTGLRVESKKATEVFYSSGASVEKHKDYNIVKLPPRLVEDCINWTPDTVVCHGRDTRNDLLIEPQTVIFGAGGGSVNIIDPFTRRHRATVKEDTGKFTLICDALEELSIIIRPCIPSDVSSETYPLHTLEEILKNTSKHAFIGADTVGNLRKMVEMGAACSGGMEKFKKQPFFGVLVCPTSPLKLMPYCCGPLMEAARIGLPIFIITMALAGATSPLSIAGTLALTNAEILGSITLAQLTKKGTPCIYGNVSTIMDMKTGCLSAGAPEWSLISMGAAKLAQYYRIPSLVGAPTDSKIPDAQSGYETSINTLTSALAGANIILSAGALDQLMTLDYAKLIMDAELNGMIKRIIKGINTNVSDLSLDIIHEVGPGGEFLTHQHTYEHIRKITQGTLFDRNRREDWLEAGGKDLAERAYEKAQHLIKSYKPKALPKGAEEKMRTIIAEYEAEIGIS